MSGLLFVTAGEADFKAVNLALMHLRDWEYGSGDRFHVMQYRNAYEFDPPTTEPDANLEETEAGSLDETNYTKAWTGASIEDIEAFALSLNKDDNVRGDPGCLFLVLDDQGLREKSVVIVSYRFSEDYEENDGEAGMKWESGFNKARVPWDEVYSFWCNLDIANMDFEDFCDQDNRPDGPPYWWDFKSVSGPLGEEDAEKRDEEIRELEQEGKI